MQDGLTTSWQRLTDQASEVDRMARLAGPVRILIVDNDIGAADSLESMLNAAANAETRVAYSGHAALAIATGDAGARETGWNRLQTAPIATPGASEAGRMEPTVARRG